MQTSHRKRIAVLGCDSFIGSCAFNLFLENGWECVGTTRRAENVRENVIYLDAADATSWHELFSQKPQSAVAFLAVSKLQECEGDPQSRRINVECIPDLLAGLARQGCRTLFVSTNAVFGGDRELCHEMEPVAPRIAYAQQKCDAENRIRELAEKQGWKERSAMVRITRTIDAETSPFSGWIRQLEAGDDIEAFDDFVFAPISRAYASRSILNIVASELSGIFHLSGRDISYCDFARLLARAVGSRGAVLPTTSTAKGVNLLFRPRFSALGMRRTAELLGIHPQEPGEVVVDLLRNRSFAHGLK